MLNKHISLTWASRFFQRHPLDSSGVLWTWILGTALVTLVIAAAISVIFRCKTANPSSGNKRKSLPAAPQSQPLLRSLMPQNLISFYRPIVHRWSPSYALFERLGYLIGMYEVDNTTVDDRGPLVRRPSRSTPASNGAPPKRGRSLGRRRNSIESRTTAAEAPGHSPRQRSKATRKPPSRSTAAQKRANSTKRTTRSTRATRARKSLE